jgi:hypothetical protein
VRFTAVPVFPATLIPGIEASLPVALGPRRRLHGLSEVFTVTADNPTWLGLAAGAPDRLSAVQRST